MPTEGVEVLSGGVSAEMVGMLQGFFTSHRDAYYRDPLFFFSLFLQDILPGLRRIILMDIDVRVSTCGNYDSQNNTSGKIQFVAVLSLCRNLRCTYLLF